MSVERSWSWKAHRVVEGGESTTSSTTREIQVEISFEPREGDASGVSVSNEALGEIEDSMIRQGIPAISVRPETPDFQALARAFNCRACRPESLAAFQEELTAAFAADRPTLIELRQDAAYLP